MNMTEHMQTRLQQRSIPPLVIELLEQFGSEKRLTNAVYLYFDKAARKRLKRHLGGERNLRIIAQWLNIAMILGDDGAYVTPIIVAAACAPD